MGKCVLFPSYFFSESPLTKILARALRDCPRCGIICEFIIRIFRHPTSNIAKGTRVHVYRWLDNAVARKESDKDDLKSLPEIKTKSSWVKKIHPGMSETVSSASEMRSNPNSRQ